MTIISLFCLPLLCSCPSVAGRRRLLLSVSVCLSFFIFGDKQLTNLENLEDLEIRKSAKVSENVRLASGAAGGQTDWCAFVCPDTSNYYGAWWPGLPWNLYIFCVLVLPGGPGEESHRNSANGENT